MKGIYKITNSVNGKLYIGQSVNMSNRQTAHFEALRSKRHYNNYLQKSFNKYGESNFVFTIIEECELLDEREIYWIKYFKSTDRFHGYNLLYGGTKFKMTQEIKERISSGLKIFFIDNEEAKQRLSNKMKGRGNYFYGKKHSKESIALIVSKNTGRIMPEEERARRSKNLKENPPNRGRKFSETAKNNMSKSHIGQKACNKIEFNIEQIENIIKLFEQNVMLKDIAIQYNVSNIPIKRILIENGVYVQKKPRKPLTGIEKKDIIGRLEKGESLVSVSKTYNLSAYGLRQKIRKWSVIINGQC